jgi:protein-L-isoaspartate(D-aspartate) O-methyltransferase
MVDNDLHARGVRDPRVLEAMSTLPRERFVGPALRDEAYSDRPLPIGHGQTISQPLIVAMMVEALELRPSDRVLEVGTGSGYAAAVAALLARSVDTVERYADLADGAAARLRALGFRNVSVHVGDGTFGWMPGAPYDAVLVSAGGTALPEPLVDQLAVGGRLVIPLGATEGWQRLYRLRRHAKGHWTRDDLGAVRFVPLVSAPRDQRSKPRAPDGRRPESVVDPGLGERVAAEHGQSPPGNSPPVR